MTRDYNLLEEKVEMISKDLKDEQFCLKECVGQDDDGYDIYEYSLDAVYDLTLRIGINKEYKGCEFAVSLGGPNIYIDTYTLTIDAYWGGEHIQRDISREMIEKFDDLVKDYYLDCLY